MPRINPIDPNQAQGKAKTLLDAVQGKFGRVPNLMKTMANSPAVLESYLGFSQTIAGGSFSPALREQIALAIAGVNGCDYCASAHSAIGKGAGLGEEELQANLRGASGDQKVEAALTFAKAVVTKRGWVADEDVENFRAAGYTDGELTEVIALVALNTFSNYFNHIAETEVDFPLVESGEHAKV